MNKVLKIQKVVEENSHLMNLLTMLDSLEKHLMTTMHRSEEDNN